MQRTTVGLEQSSWKDIKYVVPQSSILGPIIFIINLCDLFFIIKDVEIVGFADDNTPYMSVVNITDLVENLKYSAGSFQKQFPNN